MFNIINNEFEFCTCCMKEHSVSIVEILEKTIFKDIEVEFKAIYKYCDDADEYYEENELITLNDITMKNEYRKKVGLLTSDEICKIRAKYGISQSDLCLLLGWGAKTITRYETHHVQDNAHDTILRKLDSDPEWFLALLDDNKDKLTKSSYQKYKETATNLFENAQDTYLRKNISARYARLSKECSGNTALNFDKIVDVICYLSNSDDIISLFKVKLMKMLWYVDSLSFKRYNHSMMGLVYRAQERGAVPVAHESILELKGIQYEEVEFEDEGIGYKFIKNSNTEYPTLTDEDKNILNDVIHYFGSMTKNEIVERMHKEDAYIETALHDIIQYKYADTLSID